MKTITMFLIGLFLICGLNIFSQTVIFEEKFSYITDTFYPDADGKGDAVVPDDEFDFYTDNFGWSGEVVCIGSPTFKGNITFNDVPKFRVNYWNLDAYLTTPAIDCSVDGGVTLTVKLKNCSRSNTPDVVGHHDYKRARVLHAPDGVNFNLLDTVDIDYNWNDYSFNITDGTVNSKFRFASAGGTPNRFFVDSVVVVTGQYASIHNKKYDSEVEVYPKLVTDHMTVNTMHDVKNILVFSLLGYPVINQKETIINVSNLSSGIYTVLITLSNGEKVVKKILKK